MTKLTGWNKVPLKDNLDILTGYAFSSKKFNDSDGLPLIRIRDLLTHNPMTKYSGEYDEQYLIEKNDVLIGMDGEFNIVRWKGPKSLLNQRVAKIKSRDKNIIDNKFIFYRMHNELKRIEALTPATTVKHLAKKDIQNLTLQLPPLEEQQKIAAILSSVDEAIEKTEQIIEQTETVKKGLMQQLLTKGIGHKDFQETKLGEIPSTWKVVKLSDIFERVRTKNDLKKEYPVLTIAAKIGLVNQKERFNKVIAGKSLEKYIKLEKGQFAYNRGNSKSYPYGAIYKLNDYEEAVVPFVYYCFDKRDNQDIDIEFYQYYFLSHKIDRQLRRIITSSARQDGLMNISFDDFFKTEVVLPSLSEQKKITSILNAHDNKLGFEENNLQKLLEIKQGLMQQLLTGKVRVPIDDNEEVTP